MSNTMFILNRSDLAKRVAEQYGISQAKALAAVSCIFKQISEELEKGNTVNITGFGKFEVRTRASRTGINPATGEKIQIPSVKSPAFRAGKQLKEAVR
jgi:DNA-binding protein HU-beta